jgi:hypothetical protein
LTERYFKASPTDLKLLRKDFVSNEQEPSIFRVDAAFTLGLLKWDVGDKEAAADYYRMGLEIAAGTSDSERSRAMEVSTKGVATYTRAVGDSTYTRTVGEKMDELTKIMKKNLRKLERPRLDITTPEQFETRFDGSTVRSRQDFVPLYNYPSITERLVEVGGTHCDCCGKGRQELGLATLMICTRCKMAYYCSKECQKSQWKAGHKQACRKSGQIEVGDWMQLQGLVSQPQLNMKIVEIRGPNENTSSGRWTVYLPDEDRVLSVSTDRLKRLRPTK